MAQTNEPILDVVILGAGVQGLSLASRLQALQQQGLSLSFKLLEVGSRKKPRAAMANSAGQVHGRFSMPLDLFRNIQKQEFGRQGAGEEEAEEKSLGLARILARLAVEGCHDFHELVDRRGLTFYPEAMHAALTKEDAAAMRAAVQTSREDYGLPARYVEQAEVLERLGVKRRRYFGGIIHPESGYFDPLDLYPRLVADLEAKGADIAFDCKAQSVTREGDFLRVATSKQGDFLARVVVAAGVKGDKINAAVVKRIMHYAAHVFTAKQESGRGILPNGGAFDEEADPFLFVTRVSQRLMFGYADTAEMQGAEGIERLEAKAAQRLQGMARWLEGRFYEQLVRDSHRAATLHVTASGLPDVSESHDGKLITSHGLSGIGHNVGALLARLITARVLSQLGHDAKTQDVADYVFMRDGLPKGRELSAQLRTRYVEENLSPSRVRLLAERSPEMAFHI